MVAISSFSDFLGFLSNCFTKCPFYLPKRFLYGVQITSSMEIMKISNSFFNLLSRFKHFLPSYFQDQVFSSRILPKSDIFFQVTSKIRHFLPSYFQDQTFSCKILQDQTFSSKIFQDTCKNNALSSKIFVVKSDRFLKKMYGSSTGAAWYECDIKFSRAMQWDYVTFLKLKFSKLTELAHTLSKNTFQIHKTRC